MAEMDRLSQEKYGIPTLILMENAGRGVSEEVMKELSGKGKVVIVCGKGNNGGDAITCARHLMNNDIDLEIFLIGKTEELKGDAKTNYEIIRKMGALVRELSFESMEFFEKQLEYAVIIVDGIFGTGLSREIREPYKTVIEKIKASGKSVISVDVPSGLNATTGEVLGTCIKAKKTVTMAFPKTGFKKKQGPEFIGELIVKDISIPKELLDEISIFKP